VCVCVHAKRACLCTLKFTSHPQRVPTKFVVTNMGSLLIVFIWRVRKLGNASSCLSVRPHVTTRFPQDGFS